MISRLTFTCGRSRLTFRIVFYWELIRQPLEWTGIICDHTVNNSYLFSVFVSVCIPHQWETLDCAWNTNKTRRKSNKTTASWSHRVAKCRRTRAHRPTCCRTYFSRGPCRCFWRATSKTSTWMTCMRHWSAIDRKVSATDSSGEYRTACAVQTRTGRSLLLAVWPFALDSKCEPAAIGEQNLQLVNELTWNVAWSLRNLVPRAMLSVIYLVRGRHLSIKR